jgi:acetyl esterase/lipase
MPEGGFMSFLDRMDAEHRQVLESIPLELVDLSDIPRARLTLDRMTADDKRATTELPEVNVTDYLAPGPDSAREVMVRVYRPAHLEGDSPALYWIHGGGLVMGSVASDDLECMTMARDVECVVASVEYRLAPEHPYPAPVEDCYAGLMWLYGRAAMLGVDPCRVAIGGASAGGGLAAALGLMVRDRREVDIVFQLLIYPMLDDRNDTPSCRYVTNPRVWNRKANQAAWAALLGEAAGGENVSPYAAPSRATDLSGLPPTYVAVGELDLFLDENIDFASRLLRSGVATELHVYPGAFHGSDILVPDSALSRRWIADRNAALEWVLHGQRRL